MRTLRLVLTCLLVASGLGAAPTLTAQQASMERPDFSGVWYVRWRVNYPQTQWYPSELPFTEYGREVFEGNIPGKGPRQVPPAFGNDPIGKANPAGLYRTLIYFRPMEIVQTDDKLVQLFDLGKHWRTIWTDGRAPADEIVSGPFWYGYSVGHWEGDTLVVTTNNLDGRQWIDEWGTPISEYDATIEERWTRVSETELELQITVIDPVIYTQPWTSATLTYTLQTEGELSEPLEQLHTPMDEEMFNDLIRDPVAIPEA